MDESAKSSDEWVGTSVKHNTTNGASSDINLADAESIKIFRCAFAKAPLWLWLWPDQNAIINEEIKQQM